MAKKNDNTPVEYASGGKPGVKQECGMSSKIDPLFRLNLTHPNVFRVWVSFFIISDFHTVI